MRILLRRAHACGRIGVFGRGGRGHLVLVLEDVLIVVVEFGVIATAQQEEGSRTKGTCEEEEREGKPALLAILVHLNVLDLLGGGLELHVEVALALLLHLVVVPADLVLLRFEVAADNVEGLGVLNIVYMVDIAFDTALGPDAHPCDAGVSALAGDAAPESGLALARADLVVNGVAAQLFDAVVEGIGLLLVRVAPLAILTAHLLVIYLFH